MLVIEVIFRNLLIHLFLQFKPRSQLAHLGLVISLLQIKFLRTNRSVFLITIHCIVKKCPLLIDDLVQPLDLRSHTIKVFIGQDYCLNNSPLRRLRWTSRTLPLAICGRRDRARPLCTSLSRWWGVLDGQSILLLYLFCYQGICHDVLLCLGGFRDAVGTTRGVRFFTCCFHLRARSTVLEINVALAVFLRF